MTKAGYGLVVIMTVLMMVMVMVMGMEGQGGRSWQAFGERKKTLNSFVGCVFANLQQKTSFLPDIPKLQQKSGRKNAIFGLMEKLTV